MCTQHPLFVPQASKWTCFRYKDKCSRDTGQYSKLEYLGMKVGSWQTFQKLYFLSSHCQPSMSKLNLFSPHGQRADFQKMRYLGVKLGLWRKFQKMHIFIYLYAGVRNVAYFCSTGGNFRDTGGFSKLA